MTEYKSNYRGSRRYTVERIVGYKNRIEYRTDVRERAVAFKNNNCPGSGIVVEHERNRPAVNPCRVCGRDVYVSEDWKEGRSHYNCDPGFFHRDCDETCDWIRKNRR